MKSGGSTQKQLVVATYNCQGLSKVKVQQLKQYIERWQIDVVFLQEMHNNQKVSMPGYTPFVNEVKGYKQCRNIQTLVRNELYPKHTEDDLANFDGYQFLQITLQTQEIFLINAYYPSGKEKTGCLKPEFIMEFLNALGADYIMGGDLNRQINHEQQQQTPSWYSREGKGYVYDTIISSTDILDVITQPTLSDHMLVRARLSLKLEMIEQEFKPKQKLQNVTVKNETIEEMVTDTNIAVRNLIRNPIIKCDRGTDWKVFEQTVLKDNPGTEKKKHQFLRSRVNAKQITQMQNIADTTKKSSRKIMKTLLEGKFQGTTYIPPKGIPLKNKFTRFELGLEDYLGNEAEAPVLQLLSRGKGPGPDNIVDRMIHEDEEIRSQMFDKIDKIVNDGENIDEVFTEGKLMLLSKDGSNKEPMAEKTRPIVILDTLNKLLQGTLRILLEGKMWGFIDDKQMGFRMGSSTELATAKLFDYIQIKQRRDRKPQIIMSFDILGAYDHVHHQHFIKTMAKAIEKMDFGD